MGRLRAIREADSYRHPPSLGGYQGTAQEIATIAIIHSHKAYTSRSS